MKDAVQRCAWVSDDPLYQDYHDKVWGRVELDSQQLFAKLCLDGQQAGLSWITILKKQRNYEEAFYQFDPEKIATMNDSDVERLMLNPGIIRNRQKIKSIIGNAKAFIDVEKSQPFSDYIWQFTNHQTINNCWSSNKDIPVSTDESRAMAKDLKKRGFRFVGETICYAFMQAVGMVNDHSLDCHCYEACSQQARR